SLIDHSRRKNPSVFGGCMGFRDWRVRLGWLLGVGAVAFRGGYLQLVLSPRGGPAPFLYQPVGLGLALILLFGPRVAPGLALGALAAPLAAGAPAAEAAGNALAVMA